MLEGFKIVDAQQLTNYQQGLAHVRAFSDTNSLNPAGLEERTLAYSSLKRAPDYRTDLDVAIIDSNNEIASFATIWYDDFNKIAKLEPVGTIPKYRRLGLGKAVIYQVINRVRSFGAKRVYVGSDQQFYYSIGFTFHSANEVWQKKLS